MSLHIGFTAKRARRLEELKAKYLAPPRTKTSPTTDVAQASNVSIKNIVNSSNSKNILREETKGNDDSLNNTSKPQNPVPPQQHAVPWLLDPLVQNVVIVLPQASLLDSQRAAELVWVVSLWSERSRVSDNVTSNGGQQCSLMFANVGLNIDTLRLQLRTVNTTRVLFQGSLFLPTACVSEEIEEIEFSMASASASTGSKQKSLVCRVGMSLFCKRWGSSVAVTTSPAMDIVWVYQDHGERNDGKRTTTTTSMLNERGVQHLLKSASDHHDPRMILDLMDKLIPRTNSVSMQRNCELLASALGAVWQRHRSSSHTNPTLGIIGSLTSSFLNMLTTMLAEGGQIVRCRRGQQNQSQRQRGHHPVATSVDMLSGFARARALLLIESVVWSSVPLDMLLISMNTALQSVVTYLRRDGTNDADTDNGGVDVSDISGVSGGLNDETKNKQINSQMGDGVEVNILDVAWRVEVVCVLLAVGDSSQQHAARIAPLRRQWDDVASKILPTLTACATRLAQLANASSNTKASTEQYSLAGLSLLRGMASVLPPLLSRASPTTVAAHLSMFLSAFPIESMNNATRSSVVRLIAHVHETEFDSEIMPVGLGNEQEMVRFPIAKPLLECARALSKTTVEVLERVISAAAASAASAASAVGGADDAFTDPIYWPSMSLLIGRAAWTMMSQAGVSNAVSTICQSQLMRLLSLSQDLLLWSLSRGSSGNGNGGSSSEGHPHLVSYCVVVLCTLRRLQSTSGASTRTNNHHNNNNNSGSKNKDNIGQPAASSSATSTYSDGCSGMDASRLVVLTSGLLHTMRIAASSWTSSAASNTANSFNASNALLNLVFATNSHLPTISNVLCATRVDTNTNTNTNIDLDFQRILDVVADSLEHLLPSLRLASSSVVEDAMYNSSLLALSSDMVTKMAQTIEVTTNEPSSVRRRSARDLRSMSHWLRVLRSELHRPDTTWADPRRSKMSEAEKGMQNVSIFDMARVTSNILDAALSCCAAMSSESAPQKDNQMSRGGRMSSSLFTLAKECVACTMYSVTSSSNSKAADRTKITSVFAWFQRSLEKSAKAGMQYQQRRREVHGLSVLRTIVEDLLLDLQDGAATSLVSKKITHTVREVNDGAHSMNDTMAWCEVDDALQAFFSYVPILSNVKTNTLNDGEGGERRRHDDNINDDTSDEPQEHRLAEALSMMLVWWSRIEPALALPYSDGLIKLHTATSNNHSRVHSLVAKARLTGALTTQGLLPWRIYASSAIRAATAVRTAQVNDETALELCRHAHRHPRAKHVTDVDRTLHNQLRILSESILNDLQVYHVDPGTHRETSSCWYAVRSRMGTDSSDVWYVYRHDSWYTMDDFIAELRESYPHHRILAPSHPISCGVETEKYGGGGSSSSSSGGLTTLLPSSKELQVFVCHPVVSIDRDDIAGASVDVDDVEDSDDVLLSGEYIVYGFTEENGNGSGSSPSAVGGIFDRGSHRSYHKPLKNKVFGNDPERWHEQDHEIVGRCVQVTLRVHQGPVLRGLSRRHKVSSISQERLTATDTCTQWMQRLQHRTHAFIQMLEIGRGGIEQHPSREVEQRISAVHSELHKLLSNKDSPTANLQNALKIIVYYREWEMKHQRDARTKLKREWIKAKKAAKANGSDAPPEPDYTNITKKNLDIEKMVVKFTELIRNVEDAMDLCEEMYFVDMEEVRSLVGAMYGAHIEASTMEEDL